MAGMSKNTLGILTTLSRLVMGQNIKVYVNLHKFHGNWRAGGWAGSVYEFTLPIGIHQNQAGPMV